jgi:hypothetical protein
MIDFSKLITAADKLADKKKLALSQLRAARASIFITLAGMQSEALALGKQADAVGISVLQQSLRDLPALDLSACTDQASIDKTVKATRDSIVEAGPMMAKSAFDIKKKDE